MGKSRLRVSKLEKTEPLPESEKEKEVLRDGEIARSYEKFQEIRRNRRSEEIKKSEWLKGKMGGKASV